VTDLARALSLQNVTIRRVQRGVMTRSSAAPGQ
jgi:hypothetical protein